MRTVHVPSHLVAIVLAFSCAPVRAEDRPMTGWIDPVKAPAEIMPRADRGLLLDIARSGNRIIAVGERGNIIYSTDGKSWTQAEVPTRTTLTALAANGERIWAVGHDGVILRSNDRGTTWVMQRSDPLDASIPPYQRDPRQGSPLLDVLFVDAERGYAIGAYNLMLATTDGGTTWTQVSLQARAPEKVVDDNTDKKPPTGVAASADPAEPVAEPEDRFAFNDDELALGAETDPHLNGITRTGSGAFFIVSERGSSYRSRDDGVTWQRMKLPYDGSMFGVIGYEGERVLIYGLRGNVFESSDLGDNWKRVETGTGFSLIGGTVLGNDGAVLVGANGTFLARSAANEPFNGTMDLAAGALGNVLPAGDGKSLVVGENGISEVVNP